MRAVKSWIESCSRAQLALTLAGLFWFVHSCYYCLGLRFDATPLTHFMQYLDVELLRHRLAESLFYLHSQPPLFNLYLGLILKAFPKEYESAFYFSFLAMGLAFYFVLFGLLRAAGLSRFLALVLSTLFMASPSFILYEYWLFYTLPELLLVTLSALLFYEVVARKQFWPMVAFFWSLLLLCSLRSLFHLVFLVAPAGGVLLLKRSEWRRVLLAAGLPVLILAALYAKNLLVFGQFSASTWSGLSFTHVTLYLLSDDETARLVATRKLSPLASIPSERGLRAYPRTYFHVPLRFARIPALAQERRSTGMPNYNYFGVIGVSQQYFRDGLWVARHRPVVLLQGWLSAWLCYFRSSSDYWLLGSSAAVWGLDKAWDTIFYGRWPAELPIGRLPLYRAPGCEPRVYWFLLLGLPILFVGGLRRGLHGDPRLSLTRPQRLLILWACGVILYVAVAGNLLEAGENYRFRFVTDPLFLMLLGLVIQARGRKKTVPAETDGVATAG